MPRQDARRLLDPGGRVLPHQPVDVIALDAVLLREAGPVRPGVPEAGYFPAFLIGELGASGLAGRLGAFGYRVVVVLSPERARDFFAPAEVLYHAGVAAPRERRLTRRGEVLHAG
jgi:hypothetical protein